jgi:putative (di)nucleoside polyphosphate hydrolase
MKPYRKNVGMVVFNEAGHVLTGERIQFQGAWQFPQGGIDEGEELEFAAIRELYEEVGIKNATLVAEYPDWISYDFPPNLKLPHLNKYRGQIQKWFLYYWNEPISKCNLTVHDQEFKEVRFQSIDSTLDTIVTFKLDVYKLVVQEFKPIIEAYLINFPTYKS